MYYLLDNILIFFLMYSSLQYENNTINKVLLLESVWFLTWRDFHDPTNCVTVM